MRGNRKSDIQSTNLDMGSACKLKLMNAKVDVQTDGRY